MRNYEVHIDGKPFIIGERPPFNDLPPNWLAIGVDKPQDFPFLARMLAQEDGIRGIHAYGGEVAELWGWFRQAYEGVQAAGGAVQDEAGRLLAIHRLGRWDLPKGKVEPGEDIADAAVREVMEESGLRSVRLLRPLCQTWHVYPRDGRQYLKCTDWYLMAGTAADSLAPQAEEGIDAVRWLDAAGVAELRRDTYPSLLRVITAWEAAGPGPAPAAPAAPASP